MMSSQREILKFSLQIIFLTLFIYTGASQRSYHMSQNIYDGNKNSCLLSHPHVCCYSLYPHHSNPVWPRRRTLSHWHSASQERTLRPRPRPATRPPLSVHTRPTSRELPLYSVQCCTVYMHYAVLYNFHMGADLTSLLPMPAIMITTNAPCLWEIIAMMAHSCCHTFPGTTCLYLPVQG